MAARETADTLARHLDEGRAELIHVERAEELVLILARADAVDPGDERLLLLAEARDKARRLAADLRRVRKAAADEAFHSRRELGYVRSGDHVPDEGRPHRFRMRGYNALRIYHLYGNARRHLRTLIREIREESKNAPEIPRTTRTARRLIELSLTLRKAQPSHRRQSWTHLDTLSRGENPRRAQLTYATRTLLRGFD